MSLKELRKAIVIMQQLIQKSTRRLLKHNSNLCVSMFIPISDRESCKSNFLRLWNEAWTLAEERYERDEIETVFTRLNLNGVLDKVNPDYDTICLFVSKRGAYFVYLDLKISPRVVVDHTFYLKPLILTISGDDQYWLLEVRKDHYLLSLSSLSGGAEQFTAPRLKEGKRASDELKFLVRILNSDKRPWFIGGPVEDVQEARLELSRTHLKRSPSAHILHSDRPRVQESAREVIRLRSRQESETTRKDLSPSNIVSLLGKEKNLAKFKKNGLTTVLVDSNLDVAGDSYTKILRMAEYEDDLLVDDFVEEALAKNLKVVPVHRLEDKIGTPIAALKNSEKKFV